MMLYIFFDLIPNFQATPFNLTIKSLGMFCSGYFRITVFLWNKPNKFTLKDLHKPFPGEVLCLCIMWTKHSLSHTHPTQTVLKLMWYSMLYVSWGHRPSQQTSVIKVISSKSVLPTPFRKAVIYSTLGSRVTDFNGYIYFPFFCLSGIIHVNCEINV